MYVLCKFLCFLPLVRSMSKQERSLRKSDTWFFDFTLVFRFFPNSFYIFLSDSHNCMYMKRDKLFSMELNGVIISIALIYCPMEPENVWIAYSFLNSVAE